MDFDDQQQQPPASHVDDFEPLDGGGSGDQQSAAEPVAEPTPTPPPSASEAVEPKASASSSGDGNKMLLCCSYLERTDPRVKSLLLWSDPKRSAAVLFALLTLLLACMCQSFVSVLAYMGLAALLCTCALRLYAYTMKQGTAAGGGEQRDLLGCLQEPVKLPRKRLLDVVDGHLECLERDANRLLDLLLFRDSMRTLKFFCGLIVLTYIGAWFNALTLATFALVTAFCLPKAYSVYHVQVDAALGHLLDRYRHVNATIRAAIPFGKEKKN